MAESSYDCIVIGSGPGGYVAAIRAAQLGLKTAVVEKDQVVGGRCLNYACIPAKAVLRSADILTEVREANEFGITVGEPTVDFDAINARRLKVIKTLTGGVVGAVQEERHRRAGGRGRRSISGGVVGRRHRVRRGQGHHRDGLGQAPIPGVEFGGRVIGTEEAWALEQLPKSIAVVGAGASGAEIASAYARLGSEVHLFEALDRVLPTEDPDISKLVERGLKKQGMKVHTKTLVENVEAGESSVKFTAGGEQLEAEWLCIAAGRGPDIDALGLEAAGVELDERGLIQVNGALRTTADEHLRDRRHRPRPRARPQGVGRGHHRRRGRRRAGDASARPRRHPARDVLHAERRLVRADRAAGARRRARRRRRQDPVRRGRRGHGLRRPAGPDQDRRREEVRRAARRPHRRHARDRAHPGARQRARARGRLQPRSDASSTATRRCRRP